MRTPIKNYVGQGFTEIDRRIEYFVKGDLQQNFGDYLPELLSNSIFDYPKIECDEFRLIGSVIDEKWIKRDLRRLNGYSSGRIAFWCCGARDNQGIPQKLKGKCSFFGVRGPLTRDSLELPKDTILGDPGLVIPFIHKAARHVETYGKTVCIRHIQDERSDDILLSMSGADTILTPRINSTKKDLLDIIDKIASAKFVLSASLHGAIIACAYGVPFSYWDNGHLDTPFKWDDFSQSLGIRSFFAKDIVSGEENFANFSKDISRPPLLDIILCAPFAVKDQLIYKYFDDISQNDFEFRKNVERYLVRKTEIHDMYFSNISKISDEFRNRKASVSEFLLRKPLRNFWTVKRALQSRLG